VVSSSVARLSLLAVWRRFEWHFEGQGVRQAARSSGVTAPKASRINAEMVVAEQLT
jgi:hypothetical protein